jgi:hypothetical protein
MEDYRSKYGARPMIETTVGLPTLEQWALGGHFAV